MMKQTTVLANVFFGVLLILMGLSPVAAEEYGVEWIHQFGTDVGDTGSSVAVDAEGYVYVTGRTNGDIGGANAGSRDVYLAKYDPSGGLQWARQIGTSGSEDSAGVCVDVSGNVYISGTTRGTLGDSHFGMIDVFLAKYSGAGDLQWTVQLGTGGNDYANGNSVDAAGNVYVVGSTVMRLGDTHVGYSDVFLVKYDSDGGELWVRQFGTVQSDSPLGLSVSAGGDAYVTGITRGDFGGPNMGHYDAFLAKFNSAGAEQWIEQLGTSGNDYAEGVFVGAGGHVCITGWTEGEIGGSPAGQHDAFLAMYDTDGYLQWTGQLGSSADDRAYGVSVDGEGYAYMTGYTRGDLGGLNSGSQDLFLAKYDVDGEELWVQQLGSDGRESPQGVAVDHHGSAYVTGNTEGDLGGLNLGGLDAFLVKYSPDSDGDGVFDVSDDCPETPLGDGVDGDGCSLAQICPCDGGDEGWKSHGEYVRCVAEVANAFLDDGLIDRSERNEVVKAAAESDCADGL